VVLVSTSAGVKSVSALGLTEYEVPVIDGVAEFDRLVHEVMENKEAGH
jgi:hypothetical protein